MIWITDEYRPVHPRLPTAYKAAGIQQPQLTFAAMAQIKLYVTPWCPYCFMTRNLLESLGVTWEEIDIQQERISRGQLADLTGRFTVPQIIINDQPIGGYSELYELKQSGRLEMLLQESPPL